MPFPKYKTYFHYSFGSSSRVLNLDDPETGVCNEVVEDCNKKLPSSENFEISNMVKAGVTLNQVDTNILGSGVDTEALTEAISSVAKSSISNKKNEE